MRWELCLLTIVVLLVLPNPAVAGRSANLVHPISGDPISGDVVGEPCSVTPLVDGQAYFADFYRRVKFDADKILVIQMIGWQVDPMVEVGGEGMTLRSLLREFAQKRKKKGGSLYDEGIHPVQVIYWQPGAGFVLNKAAKEAQGETSRARATLTSTLLNDLHKGIQVIPLTFSDRIVFDRLKHNSKLGLSNKAIKGTISNHMKMVILHYEDAASSVAYIGGIDFAFGRWDTIRHSPRTHCQGTTWAKGRADWAQFGFRHDIRQSMRWHRRDIECNPWHDVQVLVKGVGPIKSMANAFVERFETAIEWSSDKRRVMQAFYNVANKLVYGRIIPKSESTPFNMNKPQSEVGTSLCRVVQTTPDKEDTLISMKKMIQKANKYIYIENQYFVSPPAKTTRPLKKKWNWRASVDNGIGEALYDRIAHHVEESECTSEFRVIVVMPLQSFSAEISTLSRKSLSEYSDEHLSLFSRVKKLLADTPACSNRNRKAEEFIMPVFLATTEMESAASVRDPLVKLPPLDRTDEVSEENSGDQGTMNRRVSEETILPHTRDGLEESGGSPSESDDETPSEASSTRSRLLLDGQAEVKLPPLDRTDEVTEETILPHKRVLTEDSGDQGTMDKDVLEESGGSPSESDDGTPSEASSTESRLLWDGQAEVNAMKTMTYQPIFTHSKVLIVDDRYAYVGSANINDRSLKKERSAFKIQYLADYEIGVIFGNIKDLQDEGKDNNNPTKDDEDSEDVKTLRTELWREHLGENTDDLGKLLDMWVKTPSNNSEKLFKWQEVNTLAFVDPRNIPHGDCMCATRPQELVVETTETGLKGHAVRLSEYAFVDKPVLHQAAEHFAYKYIDKWRWLLGQKPTDRTCDKHFGGSIYGVMLSKYKTSLKQTLLRGEWI